MLWKGLNRSSWFFVVHNKILASGFESGVLPYRCASNGWMSFYANFGATLPIKNWHCRKEYLHFTWNIMLFFVIFENCVLLQTKAMSSLIVWLLIQLIRQPIPLWICQKSWLFIQQWKSLKTFLDSYKKWKRWEPIWLGLLRFKKLFYNNKSNISNPFCSQEVMCIKNNCEIFCYNFKIKNLNIRNILIILIV